MIGCCEVYLFKLIFSSNYRAHFELHKTFTEKREMFIKNVKATAANAFIMVDVKSNLFLPCANSFNT